ncbi:MAG: beta-N-acetylhexosaminidase [Bacteroidales bacterium]|nr:beta-N-acetylhexosaminidase [Bacteroidales bacterium]
MKKYLVALILTICVSCTGSKKNGAGIPIIPQPDSVVQKGGFFKLDKKATISCSENVKSSVIDVFTDEVKDFLSLEKVNKGESDIDINIEPGKETEGYSLLVRKNKILISASSSNGVFYGLQSLRQLIIFSEKKNEKLLIPCCLINDAPRYGWRGIMLDESRHFFGIGKVEQMLDMMALHKLNIFHWHLTDCAGWRIEIKKYPKLMTVGGIGNHTDPDAPAAYYTQDQIAEIVKYASDRFIQIVPEIDMPGHAAASNKAYPEFSGGGSEAYPEFTFNPGKEGTYSYLTDILKEVKGLFPSPYIHLGGDEVHFGNQQWSTNQQVKSLMKKNNLADLKAVEKYFVRRMADSIKSLNKTTVGWDEIIDLKLAPKDVIVMWWRHEKPAQLDSALIKNYRVVLCPRIPLYFDFIQHETHKWGRKWGDGAFAALRTVYDFPPDSLSILKEHSSQILGIQANLWSEVIHNDRRLDFMTYPRLSAMAEAAWTKEENKSYDGFLIRIKPMLNYLKEKNIYYFDPFKPEQNPEPEGPSK